MLWAYNGLFQERGAAYMIWVRPGRLLRVSEGRLGCGACVFSLRVFKKNEAPYTPSESAIGYVTLSVQPIRSNDVWRSDGFRRARAAANGLPSVVASGGGARGADYARPAERSSGGAAAHGAFRPTCAAARRIECDVRRKCTCTDARAPVSYTLSHFSNLPNF